MVCYGYIPFCQKLSDRVYVCYLLVTVETDKNQLFGQNQTDFGFWKGKGLPFILVLELTVLQLAWVKVMFATWNIFTVMLEPKVHLGPGKFAALDF